MALRFVDSFDHYATADIDMKYEGRTGAPTITSTARNGGHSLTCTDNNTQQQVHKIMDWQETWIIGFGLYISVFSGADKPIMDIANGPTVQVAMSYQNSSQKLYLSGPFGSALGVTALTAATWYFVEIKVTIGNAGSYEFRINNTVEASASGVDTDASGGSTANRITMRAGGSSSTSRARIFDDLYICDGTGPAPYNDFLGDCRIEALFPSGNGNSSQMVGSDSDSTNNYLLVDEASQNADTDYQQSGTVGDKDTYAMTNLTPATGTVYGVQPVHIAKKTEAGTRSIVSVARLSGTEEDSADKPLGEDSYSCDPDIRTTKPGGGAWSITDVNSAEFGVKVSA